MLLNPACYNMLSMCCCWWILHEVVWFGWIMFVWCGWTWVITLLSLQPWTCSEIHIDPCSVCMPVECLLPYFWHVGRIMMIEEHLYAVLLFVFETWWWTWLMILKLMPCWFKTRTYMFVMLGRICLVMVRLLWCLLFKPMPCPDFPCLCLLGC